MHSSIASRLTGADSEHYCQHNTLAKSDTALSEFSFLLLNPVVIPGLRAGTRCAVLRGSLCVYVLICSAAKLQVCFNKLFTCQLSGVQIDSDPSVVVAVVRLSIVWLIDWARFNVPPNTFITCHIGDDFYRSYDQTNSVKALKETSWSFR